MATSAGNAVAGAVEIVGGQRDRHGRPHHPALSPPANSALGVRIFAPAEARMPGAAAGFNGGAVNGTDLAAYQRAPV